MQLDNVDNFLIEHDKHKTRSKIAFNEISASLKSFN